MARGGVYGLDRFSEYMKGLEDCYAIIARPSRERARTTYCNRFEVPSRI